MKLKGKTIILTGAGGGIGKAVARRFAEEGGRLALADVLEKEITDLAKEIRARGGEAIAIKADVSIEKDVGIMVAATLENFFTIDILVNNAAIAGPIMPLEEVSLEDWQKTININLTGQFLCAKAVLPHMKKQKGGRIINVTSIVGERPTPFTGAYNVTKAGNISLTKTLALEVGKDGIYVNCLMATLTDTPMARDFHSRVASYTGETFEERWRTRGATMPLGRVAKPEDLVSKYLQLASEEPGTHQGEIIVAP
jgi:hypothetical protein